MSNPLERSHLNIDLEEYRESHTKIFGERIKVTCLKCDLSSRQRKDEEFECPHCGLANMSGAKSGKVAQ